MPLDPNIFYNFAALRAQDNARLGQTMSNALQGYQDRKIKEAELRAKGPDYKRLAFDEFYNVAQGGQPTPQGIAAIKALSAFEGQKVTYQPDAEGNVRAVAQPSLWDTFSQMQGLQSYTPQYPVQQDTTMAGVTFPAPGVVSREPLGPLPGIEGIPPINESDLMAQSARMPINTPQSLTPQQAAALQARGDMFSGEAPPLPGGDISIPSVPGAGDRTNQALREAAGRAKIDLQKEAVKSAMAREEKKLEPIGLEQGKIATFADRMIESNNQLEGLVGAQTSLTQRGVNEVPIFGNYVTSSDFKKAGQAERNFINAVLRRESGAVISKEEFDNARKQYFPQPGDDAQVIEQKRVNRQTVIDGFIREAGPSYKPKSINILPTGAKKIGTSGGKIVYQLPDGSYVREQ